MSGDTLRTLDRTLKLIYGQPSLKADRYIAASALRTAVHRVLAYDKVIARPKSRQQRAAAMRWRRREVGRRYRARKTYWLVRAAWNRASPAERRRGSFADTLARPNALWSLFNGPPSNSFVIQIGERRA
jgi:hypothetical protein